MEKKVYKTFRIKENRFFETFYVKDGTKKQESAIMQMIRAENTRNFLRSFQVCCDKTKKMIKTHRYVLDFWRLKIHIIMQCSTLF